MKHFNLFTAAAVALFWCLQLLHAPTLLAQGMCGQPFTDPRDSNVYNTVMIGNQCWMAENLRYLPQVYPPSQGSLIAPYYYVYSYSGNQVGAAKNNVNYNTYGVLYNWYAAVNGDTAMSSWTNPSGIQGVCPSGWHLPSKLEWEEMVNAVGTPLTAGNALKTSGTNHWLTNTSANNSSGFSALPGGRRAPSGNGLTGIFTEKGVYGNWWTTTFLSNYRAYRAQMWGGDDVVGVDYKLCHDGYSVRCVRDAGTITGNLSETSEGLQGGFPNPTDGQFTFTAPTSFAGTTFQLMDATGRTISSGQMQAGNNRISLENLPSGMYLLKAGKSGEHFIKVFKR